MMKRKLLAIAGACLLMTTSAAIVRAAECGLSCCIGAAAEGVGAAEGFSLSIQYDRMDMKTIRRGTTKVSPAAAVEQGLAGRPMMAMYHVPTRMIMQKWTLNGVWRWNEDDALLVSVPYVINDMDMLMGMKMMGGTRLSPMAMDTVRGLGDVSLTYLRDVWKDAPIRTRRRLTLGIGIKAPTGKDRVRTRKGSLVHHMMQPGTGSWDALLLANGTLAFGSHADGGAAWLLVPSAIVQINGRNRLGYRAGDRLDLSASLRWRATSTFNLKLDLNGIFTRPDSSDGTLDPVTGRVAYQDPAGSMLDNTANTGLAEWFVAPGFQWVVAPGFILSGEFRLPVYQRVNGIQQVTDRWYFLRGAFRF